MQPCPLAVNTTPEACCKVPNGRPLTDHHTKCPIHYRNHLQNPFSRRCKDNPEQPCTLADPRKATSHHYTHLPAGSLSIKQTNQPRILIPPPPHPKTAGRRFVQLKAARLIAAKLSDPANSLTSLPMYIYKGSRMPPGRLCIPGQHFATTYFHLPCGLCLCHPA